MLQPYLLLLVPVAAACSAPSPETTASLAEPPSAPAATPVVVAAPGPQEPEELTKNEKRHLRKAKEALEAHEWAEARREIDAILVDPLVAEGNRHLRRKEYEEALVLAERALDVAPNQLHALLLHGEAALQVGVKLWDGALLDASIKSFTRIGDGPTARFGASRGARWLQRTEDQLRYAREGMRAVEALGPDAGWGTGVRLRLAEWPERTLGQALHDRYLALRTDDPAAASALIGEAERTLVYLMRNQPDAPWACNMLAKLYNYEERFEEGLDMALQGLARAPLDKDLAATTAASARGAGGSERVLAEFAALRANHPEAPLYWWYAGWERFDAAVTALAEGPVEELRLAEADFVRCRELEPIHEQACKGYEIMCRNAIGWSLYNAGDLSGAREAFESTEELLTGGLTYELADRLLSGVQGLNFIGDAYRNLDDLNAAADVYLALHRYQPEDAAWANNAGFFLRDAADRLESVTAVDCERAARGELTDADTLAALLTAAGLPADVPTDALLREQLFTRAAATCRERALTMFETSYEAYLKAAELAPDDIRVLNDTALIAVHHLGRDLERAEAYLKRSVELGAQQLEVTELEGEELDALTEAWGDAHQNLGTLYLDFENDPQTARVWFEKSLEIGPFPRPIVTEEYLPRCAE